MNGWSGGQVDVQAADHADEQAVELADWRTGGWTNGRIVGRAGGRAGGRSGWRLGADNRARCLKQNAN